MTTIQKGPSIGDKAELDYSKGITPYMPEEVDDFETEVTRFRNGEYEDPLKFTAYRLMLGVYGQRQPDVQMVRIKIPLGHMTPDQLVAVADVADEFSDGILHVTTRQDYQMHWVDLDRSGDVMRRLAVAGMTTRGSDGEADVSGTPTPCFG